MLDGHIHIMDDALDKDAFVKALHQAQVTGGTVISLPPNSFGLAGRERTFEHRLENVLFWCSGHEDLYPFFWIDPLEESGAAQVATAADRGVAGFKVICDRFYPSDERAMRIFSLIAARNKPIMFHSGILWDGTPSSRYNRPAEFEALMTIKGLRFSLAHIGWPWCDELIAVYGKIAQAKAQRSELDVEMFIDTTPGTPKVYRQEVFRKLILTGYKVENSIFFGSDNETRNYNPQATTEWVQIDREILEQLNISEKAMEKYFGNNLKRFVQPDTL